LSKKNDCVKKEILQIKEIEEIESIINIKEIPQIKLTQKKNHQKHVMLNTKFFSWAFYQTPALHFYLNY
jgi:hypothetical protein